MEAHRARVSKVSTSIAGFHATSTPFRIYHGTTNSTRPSSRTHHNTVDISSLDHILSIDTSTRTCLVEPNVAMDDLVAAALRHDLVPPVIPEFPGITVGGAFAGTAGESSSFRYGFFEDCVNWAEFVLADGEVVRAGEGGTRELFDGCKGTFGTVGVGTLFEVRLVRAGRYVRVRYLVVREIEEAKRLMEEECGKGEDEVQFVDGIMFGREMGVVVAGRMCDGVAEKEAGLELATFSKATDPWYYLHVEDVMKECLREDEEGKGVRVLEELIPLQDYLFRYDRGAFWTGRYAFKYFMTPFNRVTRWVLDRFMHTRVMYHALHRSGLMQRFIIQDMAVPWHNIEPFFEWLDTELDIYPLWLAPLRLGKGGIQFDPDFRSNESTPQDSQFVLNVGVWGFCPDGTLKINRAIEAKLMELKGMKWLYSQTFYTEEEFWSIYNRKWYDQLRSTYKAQSLPDVYEKVGGTALNHRDALTGVWSIWPLAGIYGVLSTLKGGDYLRKR